MRTAEIITIYLAIGAPFGVAAYLLESAATRRLRPFAIAVLATLLWPVASVIVFVSRKRRAALQGCFQAIDNKSCLRVEKARQEFNLALDRVEETGREALGPARAQPLETAMRAIRDVSEKYLGLMLEYQHAMSGAEISARAAELCRLAGRSGEDLSIAERCLYRRNLARLRSHSEHARTEFIHALAEARELAADTHALAPASLPASGRWCDALLMLYGRAIEMVSLLDDDRAAAAIARLLDAECARLRRLETSKLRSASGPFKEEEWINHPDQSNITPLPRRTLPQG